jgi:cAMP-dependent protein kinase regulator
LEIETKLFPDLAPEEFRRIVDKLVLQHYEEDTMVVQEGDPGDSMFIIAHGEVRVLTRDAWDREVVLANLREGDFFGEVSLLTGKPRTATIITNVESDLLELKREDFDQIIQEFPGVRRVVEDFHQERAYKTIEAMIQAMRSGE